MSDRKYRFRGYQDDDRREERPRAPRGPRGPTRSDGAPRGRGVGMPTAVAFKCANCGHEIVDPPLFAPDELCAKCSKPLHCCTNCNFFDPSSRFECRKTLPARVESKVKANECAFFQPKVVRDLKSQTPATPMDARSAFDALFKK